VNLILLDYGVHFSSVILATAYALVVGKAVLLAKKLPFLRQLDTAPIIQPVLFKSIIYFVMVLLVWKSLLGTCSTTGRSVAFHIT
jgi:hypothetical protein